MPILTIAVVLWGAPAYAYLDPGTGSMVLQIILGGVAGALVVLKLYWHKLKTAFGFGKVRRIESKEGTEERSP